jgi:hypothetical protein
VPVGGECVCVSVLGESVCVSECCGRECVCVSVCVRVRFATAACMLLLASDMTVAALCPVDDEIYGIEIFPSNLTNLFQPDLF